MSESSPGSECLHALGHGAQLDAPEAGSSEEGCSLNPFCFQSAACSAGVIGDQEKQSLMMSPPGCVIQQKASWRKELELDLETR